MRLLAAWVVFTLAGHTAPLREVAFTPDGTILATGSIDATVKLWRVTSLSGDGQPLVTGSYDALVRTLRGHEATVCAAWRSPRTGGGWPAAGKTPR